MRSDMLSEKLRFMLLSLNTTSRRGSLNRMQAALPPGSTDMLQAVSGFDRRETLSVLARTGLVYHLNTYCGFARFGTYGSLACFLTKVLALHVQVQRRIPYMAMLEDDMALLPGFAPFVQEQIAHLAAGGVDLVQLGAWGEGYVTSLDSARRILRAIKQQGVPLNVDILFNAGHVGRVWRAVGTPWRNFVAVNNGDIQSTPHIKRTELPSYLVARPPRGCQQDRCLKWFREVRQRYCKSGVQGHMSGRPNESKAMGPRSGTQLTSDFSNRLLRRRRSVGKQIREYQ